MTAASSGPRSRPVSARRSAFRSPPTAFSSRTTRPSARGLASTQLAEARERLGRVDLDARPARARASAYSRASTRSRAPRSTGATETGTPTRAASSSSRQRRDRLDREPPDSRRGRGGRRAAAARAPRGSARTASAGMPCVAQRRDGRARRRASRASARPRRGSARGGRTPAARPERLEQPPMELPRSADGRCRGSTCVIAEVDVVDDGRELIGRRCRPRAGA